jgi:uncharacterized phage-like protein YoqJ
MILAATGHRPDKLGGYSGSITAELQLLAHRHIVKLKPRAVLSGMALGWDQAVAAATLLAGIPLVAAIPFEGQEFQWPYLAQKAYRELLAQARYKHVVCDGGYAAWKMQKRNEWMVDKCNALLALWNGSPGGTANCIGYAEFQQKEIHNLWHEWTCPK